MSDFRLLSHRNNSLDLSHGLLKDFSKNQSGKAFQESIGLILLSFFIHEEDQATFVKVQEHFEKTGNLKAALEWLSPQEIVKLQSQVGEKNLRSIMEILEQSNKDQFWTKLYAFAQSESQKKSSSSQQLALSLFNLLLDTNIQESPFGPSPELRRRVQVTVENILGKGDSKEQFINHLKHALEAITDVRVLGPILLGSYLSKLTHTKTLKHLASMRNVSLSAGRQASFFTQGRAAKSLAYLTGFASEVPVFALGTRWAYQYSGETVQTSPWQDLKSATLTLGIFRFSGHLAQSLGEKFLLINPYQKALGEIAFPKWFAQKTLPLVAQYGAMLASHGIETRLGFKPGHDAFSNPYLDTFVSVMQLQIGMTLGQRVLGARFHRHQLSLDRELKVYGESFKTELKDLYRSRLKSKKPSKKSELRKDKVPPVVEMSDRELADLMTLREEVSQLKRENAELRKNHSELEKTSAAQRARLDAMTVDLEASTKLARRFYQDLTAAKEQLAEQIQVYEALKSEWDEAIDIPHADLEDLVPNEQLKAALKTMENQSRKVRELEHKLALAQVDLADKTRLATLENDALHGELKQLKEESEVDKDTIAALEASLGLSEMYLDHANSELQSTREESAEFQRRYEDSHAAHEADKIQWFEDRESFQSKLNQLSSRVEELGQAREGLKTEYDILESQLANLEASRVEAQEFRAELLEVQKTHDRESREWKDAEERYANQLAELRSEIEGLELSKAGIVDENQNLTRRLSSLEQDYKSLEEAHDAMRQERDQLASDLASQKATSELDKADSLSLALLEEANAKVEQLNSQLLESAAEILALKEKASKLAELEDTLDKADDELLRLNAELSIALGEKELQGATLELRSEELAAAMLETESLRTEVLKLGAKLAETRTALKAAEASSAGLKGEAGHAHQQISKLTDRLESLGQDLTVKSEALQKAEAQLTDQAPQLAELLQLREEVSELRAELAKNSTALEAAETKSSGLESEAGLAQVRIAELTEQIERLGQDLTAKSEALQKAEAQLTDQAPQLTELLQLREEVSELRAELSQARTDIANEREKVGQYEGEAGKASARIAELTNQIERLGQDLSVKAEALQAAENKLLMTQVEDEKEVLASPAPKQYGTDIQGKIDFLLSASYESLIKKLFGDSPQNSAGALARLHHNSLATRETMPSQLSELMDTVIKNAREQKDPREFARQALAEHFANIRRKNNLEANGAEDTEFAQAARADLASIENALLEQIRKILIPVIVYEDAVAVSIQVLKGRYKNSLKNYAGNTHYESIAQAWSRILSNLPHLETIANPDLFNAINSREAQRQFFDDLRAAARSRKDVQLAEDYLKRLDEDISSIKAAQRDFVAPEGPTLNQYRSEVKATIDQLYVHERRSEQSRHWATIRKYRPDLYKKLNPEKILEELTKAGIKFGNEEALDQFLNRHFKRAVAMSHPDRGLFNEGEINTELTKALQSIRDALREAGTKERYQSEVFGAFSYDDAEAVEPDFGENAAYGNRGQGPRAGGREDAGPEAADPKAEPHVPPQGNPYTNHYTFDYRSAGVIGRGPNSHLRIQDATVSQDHAKVFCEGHTWYIVDTFSKNGTILNFTKLKAGARQTIVRGQYINVGGYYGKVSALDPYRLTIERVTEREYNDALRAHQMKADRGRSSEDDFFGSIMLRKEDGATSFGKRSVQVLGIKGDELNLFQDNEVEFLFNGRSWQVKSEKANRYIALEGQFLSYNKRVTLDSGLYFMKIHEHYFKITIDYKNDIFIQRVQDSEVPIAKRVSFSSRRNSESPSWRDGSNAELTVGGAHTIRLVRGGAHRGLYTVSGRAHEFELYLPFETRESTFASIKPSTTKPGFYDVLLKDQDLVLYADGKKIEYLDWTSISPQSKIRMIFSGSTIEFTLN